MTSIFGFYFAIIAGIAGIPSMVQSQIASCASTIEFNNVTLATNGELLNIGIINTSEEC